jgi:hypothetical protein
MINLEEDESRPQPPASTDSATVALGFWTEARRELRAWFSRNANSLGQLYEGALTILYGGQSTPGWPKFLTHAMREIGNRLPDVFRAEAEPEKRERFEQTKRLDGVARAWHDAKLPSMAGSEAPEYTDIPIPRQLYVEIERLVTDHVAVSERRADAARRLFLALGAEAESPSIQPAIKHWLDLLRWAVARAHDPAPDETFDFDDFRLRFEQFEKILMALVRDFFKTSNEDLDEILDKANR